jgi:hypothetical protein
VDYGPIGARRTENRAALHLNEPGDGVERLRPMAPLGGNGRLTNAFAWMGFSARRSPHLTSVDFLPFWVASKKSRISVSWEEVVEDWGQPR